MGCSPAASGVRETLWPKGTPRLQTNHRLVFIRGSFNFQVVSTVQEIEAAIRALPAKEREQLVHDLPSILPELNGDAEWNRIIHDARPRNALSALGDEIEAQFKTNPRSFNEIRDSDFDKNS